MSAEGERWLVSPVGGVAIENVDRLFSGGVCPECRVPHGTRTRRRMVVRHYSALSRRDDGVLAQLAERPKGPTFCLFTKRFLSLLSPGERQRFRWRPVTIANPTKITPALFELVASKDHLPLIALEGLDENICEHCGRGDSLPGRDRDFLALSDHGPTPPWCTIGEWTRGVYLAVTAERLRTRPGLSDATTRDLWLKGFRGVTGIHTWRLKSVDQ